MKPVNFFTGAVAIIPHSATHAAHLSRVVTVEEFASGQPVAMYQLDNGDLLLQAASWFGREPYRFIEGPPA